MITLWSVFSATLWFALSTFLLFALRRNTSFLMRYGIAAWSGAMILAVVRLLLPLDSEHMTVVRSYHILPALRRVLNHPLIAGVPLKWALCAIWIAGTFSGIAFVLYGLFRDGRQLRQFPCTPPPAKIQAAVQVCGLDVNIIRVSPAVCSPMAAGLLHPTIYFPVSDYPEDALPCVLKHEACHIAGHDAWLKLGFLLFCCLFWWNPLVYFARKSIDDILELRCDRAALEDASDTEQLAYVEAISYAAKQTLHHSPSFIGASSFAQPRNSSLLVLRAKLALDEPHPRSWRVLAMFTLSLVLFAGSYLFIPQPAGFPSENDGGVPIHMFTSQTSYLKQTPSGDYELWSNGEYAGSVPADALDDELFQNMEVLP